MLFTAIIGKSFSSKKPSSNKIGLIIPLAVSYTHLDVYKRQEYIGELDQGFDFYAPQTFGGLDNQTHAVLFGWIGLPDLTYPTDKFKWHSALTLPRELRLEGSRIYQRPIHKIDENLTKLLALHLDKKADIANLDRAYLKFEANNQAFDLTFFQNEKRQSLRLSYENGDVYKRQIRLIRTTQSG